MTKKKQTEKKTDWFDDHVRVDGVGLSTKQISELQVNLKKSFEEYVIKHGDKTNGK
jgi:hypothetical protein